VKIHSDEVCIYRFSLADRNDSLLISVKQGDSTDLESTLFVAMEDKDP